MQLKSSVRMRTRPSDANSLGRIARLRTVAAGSARFVEEPDESTTGEVLQHILFVELRETNSVTTQNVQLRLPPSVRHNCEFVHTCGIACAYRRANALHI